MPPVYSAHHYFYRSYLGKNGRVGKSITLSIKRLDYQTLLDSNLQVFNPNLLRVFK